MLHKLLKRLLCYERLYRLIDTSYLFISSYLLSCCYLIIVALLLTLYAFVLFYAALRSHSIVLFLMLRTPQHSIVLHYDYVFLLTRYDSN